MWSRDAHERLLLVVAVAVAFVCCMPSSASDAGGAMPSCVSKLAPCLNATDTTPVQDSWCCVPLKEAACVCAILMNKAAPERGVLLAKRCGVTTDASTCAKYADAAASGATAAASSSTATAASTGQTSQQQVDSSKMEMCVCPESDPPCSKGGCFCCYDGPGWPCFQTREQCIWAKACGCDKRPPVAVDSVNKKL